MSVSSVTRVIKLQDSETVKFIELYAGERLLYDSSCKEYKDKDLRSAAARRISEAMGISGFGSKEVIAKFKNLRSSYCQELKKIADSERSGTGTNDFYVPKVIWFELMNSFIRPFVQQRPTKSNVVTLTNPSSPASVEEVSQQENSIDNFGENIPSHTHITATADTINIGQTGKMKEAPTTFKRKAPPEPSSSKIKKTSQDPQVDYICGVIEKLEEMSNRAALIPKEDCYDCFGKYISSMLRNIGPPTAMRLQEQITHLVTQAMCPPPPSWSQPASNRSSNETPSHYSAMSDYSDD